MFVQWRDKFGNDTFNKFSDILASIRYGDKMTEEEHTLGTKNKGKLKLDPTGADQNIANPTDLTLLNKAREKTE